MNKLCWKSSMFHMFTNIKAKYVKLFSRIYDMESTHYPSKYYETCILYINVKRKSAPCIEKKNGFISVKFQGFKDWATSKMERCTVIRTSLELAGIFHLLTTCFIRHYELPARNLVARLCSLLKHTWSITIFYFIFYIGTNSISYAQPRMTLIVKSETRIKQQSKLIHISVN